ncbi:MAG TPA: response regulator transcription factor [Bryobacteraceae bacterium]|nr:response regulator transcription factor [Bryobacteraceae bacterium]
MARVLLLTDEPVLAAGFTSVLQSAAGFESVSVCAIAADLAAAVQAHSPDVLLIDLTPEVTFGILTQLRREYGGCRLVLWVRSISTELAYQAMEMGVRGVLRKTLSPELLAKCLMKVAEGELWFDKSLTASFLSAKMVSLTKRESQLVGLLSQGLKNKEIATTLTISEGTVKVYLSRLFQKVGVKDRFELALYGLRNLQNVAADPGAGDPNAKRLAPHGLRSLVLERSPGRPVDPFPVWAPRS